MRSAFVAIVAVLVGGLSVAGPAGAASNGQLVAVGGYKRCSYCEFQSGLFTFNVDGSGLRMALANPPKAVYGDIGSPSWSPDGNEIAFEASRAYDPATDNSSSEPSEIYVLDLRNAQVRELTHDGLNDNHPSWSPDGRRIAYMHHNRSVVIPYGVPPPPESEITFDPYVMNADGSDPRPVLKDADWEFDAAWSPAGDRIAYSLRAGWAWLEPSAIWTVRPDGTDARKLVDGPVAIEPSWSPDGAQIAYTLDQPTTRQVAIQPLAGGAPVLLSPPIPQSGPEAHLGENLPAWSPDGTMVVAHTDRIEPLVPGLLGGLVALPVNGGSPRKVIANGTAVAGGPDVDFYAAAWQPCTAKTVIGCVSTGPAPPPLNPGGGGGSGGPGPIVILPGPSRVTIPPSSMTPARQPRLSLPGPARIPLQGRMIRVRVRCDAACVVRTSANAVGVRARSKAWRLRAAGTVTRPLRFSRAGANRLHRLLRAHGSVKLVLDASAAGKTVRRRLTLVEP